jgi:hypothetical protein
LIESAREQASIGSISGGRREAQQEWGGHRRKIVGQG